MNESNLNVDKLARAWIFAHHLGIDNAGYENQKWAVDAIIEMAFDKPKELWEIILKILEIDSSPEIVGAVGAGPLEDLVVQYADQFIDSIESQARNSETFRAAMRGVWLDDEDTPMKSRFISLAQLES